MSYEDICVNCGERIKAFDGLLLSGSKDGWVPSHSPTCEGRGQIDYEAQAESLYQVICNAQRMTAAIVNGHPAGTPDAGKYPEFDAAITNLWSELGDADKIAWGDGQPKLPTPESESEEA